MTVREYLKRKQRKINVIVLIPHVALIALYFLGIKPALALTERIVALLFFAVIYSACWAYFISKVRCPKCNFSYSILSVRERKRDQINFCPGCGLSMETAYATDGR